MRQLPLKAKPLSKHALCFALLASTALSCKPRRSDLSSDDFRDPYKCENKRLNSLFVEEQDQDIGSWQSFGIGTIADLKAAKDLANKLNIYSDEGDAMKLIVAKPTDNMGKPMQNTWQLIANKDTLLALKNGSEAFRINDVKVQYAWLAPDHRQVFLLTGAAKTNILRIDLAVTADSDLPQVKAFLTKRENEVSKVRASFRQAFVEDGLSLTSRAVSGDVNDPTTKDRLISRIFKTKTLTEKKWFITSKQFDQAAAWNGTLIRGIGNDPANRQQAFVDLFREGDPAASSIIPIKQAVLPFFDQKNEFSRHMEITALTSKQILNSSRQLLYAAYKGCASPTTCWRGFIVIDGARSQSIPVYSDFAASENEGAFYSIAANELYPPLIAVTESKHMKDVQAQGTTVKIFQTSDKEHVLDAKVGRNPYQLIKTINFLETVKHLSFEKNLANRNGGEGKLVVQHSFGENTPGVTPTYFLAEIDINRMLHGITVGSHKVAKVSAKHLSWRARLLGDKVKRANIPSNQAVEALTFGPDCLRFVSGGSDGSIKFWDLAELASKNGPVEPKDISADYSDSRVIAIKSTFDLKTFLVANETGHVTKWAFDEGGGIKLIDVYPESIKHPESPDAPALPEEAPQQDGKTLPRRRQIRSLVKSDGLEWDSSITYSAATWLNDRHILIFGDTINMFDNDFAKMAKGKPIVNIYAKKPTQYEEPLDPKHLMEDLLKRTAMAEGSRITAATSVSDGANGSSQDKNIDPRKTGVFYIANDRGYVGAIPSVANEGENSLPGSDGNCVGPVLDVNVPYHSQWILTSYLDGCIKRVQNRLIYKDNFSSMNCVPTAETPAEGSEKKVMPTYDYYFQSGASGQRPSISAFTFMGREDTVGKIKSLASLDTVLSADVTGTLNLFSAYRACADIREPPSVEVDSKKLRGSFSRENEVIMSMAVTDNFKYAVTGSANGNLVLWWVGESIDLTR